MFGRATIRLGIGPHSSSTLKMHYRPEKFDGSAQRGRSMLSTIALFNLLYFSDACMYDTC